MALIQEKTPETCTFIMSYFKGEVTGLNKISKYRLSRDANRRNSSEADNS